METGLIYDFGMHKGEDAEFYLRKGFRVLAVEADPELATSAASRLETYIRSGQLRILNNAIAQEKRSLTFYKCENITAWGTISKEWAKRNAVLGGRISEITVDAITFTYILQNYGTPYYIKIDIEGADVICLEQLLKSSFRPKYISLESAKNSFHDLLMEFTLLSQLGYNNFKVIPQHKINSQRLPKPAREGNYVDHEFVPGSSGSFGEELPGVWLTLEQAIGRYLRIYQFNRFTGTASALSMDQLAERSLKARKRDISSLLRNSARKLVGKVGRGIGLQPGWYDTHAMYSGS